MTVYGDAQIGLYTNVLSVLMPYYEEAFKWWVFAQPDRSCNWPFTVTAKNREDMMIFESVTYSAIVRLFQWAKKWWNRAHKSNYTKTKSKVPISFSWGTRSCFGSWKQISWINGLTRQIVSISQVSIHSWRYIELYHSALINF